MDATTLADHSPALLIALDKDRRLRRLYCDVTIVSDGVCFRAHRCVLGTYCGYFHTLFEAEMFGKQKDTIHLIGPPGMAVCQKTVKIIFDFIYSKKPNITSDNVHDVALASDYLQVARLKCKCVEFMKATLTPESWLRSYRIGVQLQDDGLISSCMDKFASNSTKLNLIL